MTETKAPSVYAMLGYPDPESMQLKARLADKIDETIKALGLKQTEAAERIGITQPKLSRLLSGQFRGVSEAKMLECLTALGHSVDIVIKAAPVGQPGIVSVVPSGTNAGARRSRAARPPKVAVGAA